MTRGGRKPQRRPDSVIHTSHVAMSRKVLWSRSRRGWREGCNDVNSNEFPWWSQDRMAITTRTRVRNADVEDSEGVC